LGIEADDAPEEEAFVCVMNTTEETVISETYRVINEEISSH
jgi:hypothetical protein